MDPKFEAIIELFPPIALIVTVSVAGWVVTTWLKIKNGYPLASWGTPLHPSTDRDAAERIKLLSSENAQLRAEIGSLKDRLETVERIVTDSGTDTAAQIEALHDKPRLASGDKIQ